ncbi:MAG: hypothetical protein IIC73_08875 [Armatimonadetes bacterium]|nr:hypothetical protein [Armatimonadota bacterium]
MPWCVVVAFVHGMFVQQARKKWFLATVIFGAVPFLLFLYGTFMTRSGFLGDTSVHSFAKMDSRALWLLIGLTAAAILGFVAAAFVNWRKIRAKLPAAPPMKTAPINRGTLYSIGVWLLYAIAFVTAYGMSYPLVLSLAGQKPKIIEEAIYHQNLAWLFPPLMIAMAVAPFVSWRGMGFRPLIGRITNVLAITVGLIGCILLWMKSGAFHAPGPEETVRLVLFGSPTADAEIQSGLLSFDVPKVSWVLFLTWLCLFTAVGAFWRLMEVWKKSKSSVGAMLAHFGLATALLGLIFSRGFEQKVQVLLHETEAPSAFGYSLLNLGQTSQFSDRHNKIEIEATGPDGSFIARPGLYFIPRQDEDPAQMVWPSIIRFPLKDYYFTIYQPSFEATGEETIPLSDIPEERQRAFRDMVLVYNDLRKTGQRGVDDVVFIAEMTAVFADGAYEVEPAIIVTKEGRVIQVPVRINDKYNLVLSRVDSETLAITVQLEYIQPAYPLEVFFKPLTVFVWLGVGTMLVGGLLAAATRRKEMRAFAKKQDAS